MSEPHLQATCPAIICRLKRAEGHLRHVSAMLQDGSPSADTATQLQAVEHAVSAAKCMLIHDHIDDCLTEGGTDLAGIKALAKVQ